MNILDMLLLMNSETSKPPEWYLANGVSKDDVLGAWLAKGAVDLTTSYNSLVGDKILTTTAAPSFNGTLGWFFNGETHLLADITPDDNTTVIISYELFSGGDKVLFGAMNTYLVEEEDITEFLMLTTTSSGYSSFFVSEAVSMEEAPPASGVFALNSEGMYLDGEIKQPFISTPTFTNAPAAFAIGGLDVYEEGEFVEVTQTSTCIIRAIVAYNKKLSATQIASISAKMALI